MLTSAVGVFVRERGREPGAFGVRRTGNGRCALRYRGGVSCAPLVGRDGQLEVVASTHQHRRSYRSHHISFPLRDIRNIVFNGSDCDYRHWQTVRT